MSDLDSIEKQQQHYDEIWHDLDQSNYRQQQHYKNRIYAINALIAALPAAPKKILEVGCGMGDLVGELPNHESFTGIDLSEEGVAIAKRRFPEANFFAASILEHDFGTEKYDLVVSTEVLEHVPREEKLPFLERISDVLVEGGHLILTTPNKRLSDKVVKFQMIEDHLSQNELRDMLQVHFDIVHLTTIHRVFPVLGNSSKMFQAARAGLYEVLRLRQVLESPFKKSDRGLYCAAMCKKKPG
jgi:2-polyprenyl-3-methyl-5-hydroxy-6-metoxy-1,4-benzoquinol methylase